MKMIRFIRLLAILFFSINAFGETYLTIAADAGLFSRTKPNLTAPIIEKLRVGEDVLLISKTEESLEIKDSNSVLNGNWYLIKSKSGKKGYVFSGYLIESLVSRLDEYYCDPYYDACDTKISSKHYDLALYNYQNESYKNKNDTLFITEAVFNETSNLLLQIKPKFKDVKAIIYTTALETINPYGYAKNKDGIVPKWQGHRPYEKLIPVNSNYYRMPIIDYEGIRESRAKKMKLKRYKNWEDGGEGGWMPVYRYKGVRAPYLIEAVLIKIQLIFPDGSVKKKIVKITLSYGC